MSKKTKVVLSDGPVDGFVFDFPVEKHTVTVTRTSIDKDVLSIGAGKAVVHKGSYVEVQGVLDEQGRRVFKLEETQ